MPTSRHRRTASLNDSAGPTGTTAGRAFDVSTRGGQPAQPAPDRALDRALDDALAGVRELSLRLWAVREVHRPARVAQLAVSTSGRIVWAEVNACASLRRTRHRTVRAGVR